MAVGIEHVREIADRVAASLGLEVVEAELLGGGGGRRLRIVIDRLVPRREAPEEVQLAEDALEADASGSNPDQKLIGAAHSATHGVTHEDCANLSREVSTILDVEDAVPGGPYVLEVSSPGLDRKLSRPADFERFTGSRVKLTTRQPVNGNRHFEGRLESFQDGQLTLEFGGARKKKAPVEPTRKLEIALANVEKANLVPEF